MVRNLIAEKSTDLRLIDIESALRMVDHSALTKDGIHFNTQQCRQRIVDAFQAKIEEMVADLRTVVNPVTRDSPTGRTRSPVPQQLANRLEPFGDGSECYPAHSQLGCE